MTHLFVLFFLALSKIVFAMEAPSGDSWPNLPSLATDTSEVASFGDGFLFLRLKNELFLQKVYELKGPTKAMSCSGTALQFVINLFSSTENFLTTPSLAREEVEAITKTPAIDLLRNLYKLELVSWAIYLGMVTDERGLPKEHRFPFVFRKTGRSSDIYEYKDLVSSNSLIAFIVCTLKDDQYISMAHDLISKALANGDSWLELIAQKRYSALASTLTGLSRTAAQNFECVTALENQLMSKEVCYQPYLMEPFSRSWFFNLPLNIRILKFLN